MSTTEKNSPPSSEEIASFVSAINFRLPEGFIDFYEETDGAYIIGKENNVALWALSHLIPSNVDYNVNVYAPEYFIFGTDGCGSAYAVQKATGSIFEMPFIGMSNESALFVSKTFVEFVGKL